MKSKNKITIDSYNKTAEEYYKIVTSFEILPELEEFMNLLNPNDKILDLGCGPGHHSRIFSEKNFQVTGVDLSPEMIAIAEKEVSKTIFKVMDILDLDFKNKSFEGIWASASLLHIPKKNIKSVLRKLSVILTKKGILYLSLKRGEFSKIIKDDRYGGVDKFYVFYQLEEIVNILNEIGFEVIKIGEKEKRNFYDTNSWIHLFCKKKIPFDY